MQNKVQASPWGQASHSTTHMFCGCWVAVLLEGAGMLTPSSWAFSCWTRMSFIRIWQSCHRVHQTLQIGL